MNFSLAFLLALHSAQQTDSPAFVRKFVAAVNSKSVAQRLALQHPRDVCSTNTLVEQAVTRKANTPIPPNHKWQLKPPAAYPLAKLFTYTAKPTHVLEISFTTSQNSSYSMIVQLVHDATGWHEVFGCPTPALLAQFDAMTMVM